MIMNNNNNIYHGLKFNDVICIGCSQCMSNCPAGAIRVRNGKALMLDARCVDCGECYNVCPSRAISVEQDDFEAISFYKHKVALIPAVFIAQFPPSITIEQIVAAVYELGFSDVQIVERSVEILKKLYNQYIEDNESGKPLISTFCPSIVRLIQTKFPYFIDNLILLKPPLELTALYIRKKYEESNIAMDDIGIFYISPCAAKLVAIKEPVGGYKSPVNGVINMNYLYNKVYRVIKNNKNLELQNALSIVNGLLSLTNGETNIVACGRRIAIDGIHNVIDFLEGIENGDNEVFENIDFLELRSCGEGCAGGILCAVNKFIATERLNSLNSNNHDLKWQDDIDNYYDYLRLNSTVEKVEQRSVMKLDNDMFEAMKKMRRIADLRELLPQVDCGICGSPTCGTFSEDIVQGEASIKQCIFIQKALEKSQKIDARESTALIETIWSKDKLNKIEDITTLSK